MENKAHLFNDNVTCAEFASELPISRRSFESGMNGAKENGIYLFSIKTKRIPDRGKVPIANKSSYHGGFVS